MVKPILLSLVINLLYCFSFGQTPIRFDGSVVDNKNKPVIGARVLLKSLNKADVSNAQGDFSIDDLTQNTFVIEISCVGYETLIQ